METTNQIKRKLKEFGDRNPQNPSDIVFGKKIKICGVCFQYSDKEHSKYGYLLSASIEELEEVLKYQKAKEYHGSN